MDREQLRQYRDLTLEIERLDKWINKLKASRRVEDKIQGSDKEFPYTFYDKTHVGYKDISKREEELLKMRENRRHRAFKEKLKIERFISSIEDSRIRSIFELRYFKGKTWYEISSYFQSDDESYARKIHNRYLDKHLD